MSVTAPTAAELDAADPLAAMRSEFELPDAIYLVGNSLGAMPKAARDHVNTELDRWGTLGVEGHFTGGLAWKDYHELLTDQLAALVGARGREVVAMNALTVNLHLLMVSFYAPNGEATQDPHRRPRIPFRPLRCRVTDPSARIRPIDLPRSRRTPQR